MDLKGVHALNQNLNHGFHGALKPVTNKRPVHWSQRVFGEPGAAYGIGTVTGIVVGRAIAGKAHDGSVVGGMMMVGAIAGGTGGFVGSLVHGAVRDHVGTAGGLGISAAAGAVITTGWALIFTDMWKISKGPLVLTTLVGAAACLVGAGSVELIRRAKKQ